MTTAPAVLFDAASLVFPHPKPGFCQHDPYGTPNARKGYQFTLGRSLMIKEDPHQKLDGWIQIHENAREIQRDPAHPVGK